MSKPIYATVDSNSLLATLATLTILIGLLAFAGLIYTAGMIHNLSSYQSWGSVRVDPMLIAAGIGILFQSVVGYAALKGLSDAISILKYVGREVDRSAGPTSVATGAAESQEYDSNYVLASEYANRTGKSMTEVIDLLATKQLAGKPINGSWHVKAP